MRRYFECQKCGIVHYGISHADNKKNGHIPGEFSERDLKRCYGCGSSYPFFEVTEDYINSYGQGDPLYPWLYPSNVDELDSKEIDKKGVKKERLIS